MARAGVDAVHRVLSITSIPDLANSRIDFKVGGCTRFGIGSN